MMLLAKLKTFGIATLATAVLIAGAIGLSAQDSAQRPVGGADGPAISWPQPGPRSEPIRDADRIVRLAIEAERQQDAGDVPGARRTVGKIADAARAWQNRLSPPNEKNPTNPANAAERTEHWRKQVAARILDHDFAEAHLVELLKHVGDCQTCHTAAPHQDRAATLLEQIRAKDKELAGLRKQLEAIRGPKPAAIPNDFRGSIKAVQGDLATVTPGSDAGAAVGGVHQVYRLKPRPEYLGTIVIRSVTPHEAVGQLQGPRKAQIQAGDEVAARLQ